MHSVHNMSRRIDGTRCPADLQICATNYNFNGLVATEPGLMHHVVLLINCAQAL